MPRLVDTLLSVLDLAPIREGGSAADSFSESVALARLTERLGFTRFWLAEHHSIEGIASAATAVLIGHVAGATEGIRVGSGGIMQPNHPPLVVAEQFGTLETLYPGRIDLGLGRAPGSDGPTMAAIVGGPETVRDGLEAFLEQTGADELMLNTDVFSLEDRLKSHELVAELWRP